MYPKATECMSMDMESTNAVDASIMATMHMMQSCSLRDSGDNALKSEQSKDVDMDVDTPANETSQANELNTDSPQHGHAKHEHHLTTNTAPTTTTPLSRRPACKSAHAHKPQHKHLKHLAGVDAKCKPLAAFSLNRVMAASVQRSRMHSLLRDPRTPAKQSRFAKAVLDAIEEEA
ncbi:hypothetical protein Q7P35_010067 [Cladosporium inversicolor]